MKKDKSTMIIAIALTATAIATLFGEDPICADKYDVTVLHGWVSALISGITSLAGGIGSAVAANQQSKRASEEQKRKEQALKDWYETNVNSNILDRADTLSMLKIYRDNMEEQNKKFHTNAIKGGASEEAKVAYAQSANKGYADAISKIASQGQIRKDAVADAYMKSMLDIYDDKSNAYLNTGQTMANVISKTSNALGEAASGIEWGKSNTVGKSGSAALPTDPATSADDWDWENN